MTLPPAEDRVKNALCNMWMLLSKKCGYNKTLLRLCLAQLRTQVVSPELPAAHPAVVRPPVRHQSRNLSEQRSPLQGHRLVSGKYRHLCQRGADEQRNHHHADDMGPI